MLGVRTDVTWQRSRALRWAQVHSMVIVEPTCTVHLEILDATVRTVTYSNHFIDDVPCATMVGCKLAVLVPTTLATVGLVQELAICIKDVHAATAVAVAEVELVAARNRGKPSRSVGLWLILGKSAIDLSNVGSIKKGLGQLLFDVGMIEVLGAPLGGNVETMCNALA